MTTSQDLESFVPVYDVVPEQWDDARAFLVETLKKITNAVNVREIGWYLDEELLTGASFIPGVPPPDNESPAQFRSIFRKVIDTGGLAIGANVFPHDIVFDANFTLIKLWCSATNSGTFNAVMLTDANVTMDATDVTVTSLAVYDRAFIFIEYIKEV